MIWYDNVLCSRIQPSRCWPRQLVQRLVNEAIKKKANARLQGQGGGHSNPQWPTCLTFHVSLSVYFTCIYICMLTMRVQTSLNCFLLFPTEHLGAIITATFALNIACFNPVQQLCETQKDDSSWRLQQRALCQELLFFRDIWTGVLHLWKLLLKQKGTGLFWLFLQYGWSLLVQTNDPLIREAAICSWFIRTANSWDGFFLSQIKLF